MQSEPQAGFPDIDRFSFLMLRLVSRREQLEGDLMPSSLSHGPGTETVKGANH